MKLFEYYANLVIFVGDIKQNKNGCFFNWDTLLALQWLQIHKSITSILI